MRVEEKDGKYYVSLRPAKPKFRALLSIDGGGVRGIIPAKVLESFELAVKEVLREEDPKYKGVKDEDLVVDLKECFDMVAGNSAGSILALFIASGGGRPELYEEKGMLEGTVPGSSGAALKAINTMVKKIFTKPVFHPSRIPIVHFLSGLLYSKYGNYGLRTAMEMLFGDMSMHDLKMNAYVPAYELDKDRPVGFYTRLRSSGTVETGYSFPTVAMADDDVNERHNVPSGSAEQPLLTQDSRLGLLPKHFASISLNFPVGVVAQASSSAPVYFTNTSFSDEKIKQCLSLDQVNWVDGGVVSNNPTMQALAFLATCFSDRGEDKFLGLKDMAVLSIGTGGRRARANVRGRRQGIAFWGSGLVNVLMNSHTEVNHAIIDALFDGQVFSPDKTADRYVRINRVVRPGHRDYAALGNLDSTREVGELERIGQELGEENMDEMKRFIKEVLMAK